ncbi:uncharacterized protein VICG_01674 [Vittaforma corneae ATCC 50505]|uniref:Major facilitator superfamily (MFS) profile domain-containing protein n=1 Tax=Vittaforma corneae (strain ATCC 50505) TaxID=993615 RepID=L2GKC5_VITCO|nr:uncharacterized protein VICG_01674 [Vittaforma corneae ATCC 50505]ELA41301.1 hypothetical protein VICG_01674 [Vittaforma corneae ATCC 50505]
MRSLIKARDSFRSISIIVLLYTTFNLCGINQIFSNPKIFYGEDNYQNHVIYTLLLSVGCLLISSLIFKSWDIKPAVVLSSALIVISCIAFFFSFQVRIFTYIFSIGYNLGLSHCPFYVLGFIFPEDYRVAGTFLGLTVNRVVAVVSVFIPLGSPQQMHTPVFIGYALLTAFTALYICLVYEDTKGKDQTFSGEREISFWSNIYALDQPMNWVCFSFSKLVFS